LRLLDLRRPDVIVSDLGMPREDGYALIEAIRRRDPQRGGAVPAAALTAYVRPEDQSHAIAAGFQMHLGKPVEETVLLDAVEALATLDRPRSRG
jgi:CheY-like chemotaxis protein